MAGKYMYICWTFRLRSYSGSGLQIVKLRRPARVKVSSFDVCIVLGSRKRSGERLSSSKVDNHIDNHGTDLRMFEVSREISSFSQTKRPADPRFVLITLVLFSNAVLTSLVQFF